MPTYEYDDKRYGDDCITCSVNNLYIICERVCRNTSAYNGCTPINSNAHNIINFVVAVMIAMQPPCITVFWPPPMTEVTSRERLVERRFFAAQIYGVSKNENFWHAIIIIVININRLDDFRVTSNIVILLFASVQRTLVVVDYVRYAPGR